MGHLVGRECGLFIVTVFVVIVFRIGSITTLHGNQNVQQMGEHG